MVSAPLVPGASRVVETQWGAQAVEELRGHRALIVDDHLINCRILRLQLEAFGMSVDVATEAEAGWRLLQHAIANGSPYTMAIVDFAITDTGGAPFVWRIRDCKALSELRLLVRSSSAVRALTDEEKSRIEIIDGESLLPRCLIDHLCQSVGGLRRSVEGERCQHAAETSTLEISLPPTIGQEMTAKVRQPRLLLVGDNIDARPQLVGNLSAANYWVQPVATASEAVRAAASASWDLIILDFATPIPDSVDAAVRICSSGAPAGDIPMIVALPVAGPEMRAEFQALGIGGFVTRPIDHDILLSVVDAALDRASRNSALATGAQREAAAITSDRLQGKRAQGA